MGKRPVVLIGQPLLSPLIPILEPLYDAVPLWEDSGDARRAEARAMVWAGEFPLSPALIDAMPQLADDFCPVIDALAPDELLVDIAWGQLVDEEAFRETGRHLFEFGGHDVCGPRLEFIVAISRGAAHSKACRIVLGILANSASLSEWQKARAL